MQLTLTQVVLIYTALQSKFGMMHEASSPREWITSFDNERLKLTIFLTEQCNFRCKYCYEDFKLGPLEPFVIEGIKNLILQRSKDLNHLELSFFGGEPLMNLKTLLDLSNWAQSLGNKYKFKYDGGITTNGYSLYPSTFQKLIQASVRSFQITLDGNREYHDLYRPTINNKPTFDKIIENILAIKESHDKFDCLIRFNVTDDNLASILSFLDEHGSKFSSDLRFRYHFHPVFGMPEMKLTKAEELETVKEKFRKKKLILDEDNQNNANYVCYASKANSYVIRSNGIIQKCTVALDDDRNNIGKLTSSGDLCIDSNKHRLWLFTNTKDCPLQSLSLIALSTSFEDERSFIPLPVLSSE